MRLREEGSQLRRAWRAAGHQLGPAPCGQNLRPLQAPTCASAADPLCA